MDKSTGILLRGVSETSPGAKDENEHPKDVCVMSPEELDLIRSPIAKSVNDLGIPGSCHTVLTQMTIALQTGMRRSELSVFRWGEIDGEVSDKPEPLEKTANE